MAEHTTISYDERSLKMRTAFFGEWLQQLETLFGEVDAELDQLNSNWVTSTEQNRQFQLKWQERREARDAKLADLRSFYEECLSSVTWEYERQEQLIDDCILVFQKGN